jgi:hypothetical protein
MRRGDTLPGRLPKAGVTRIDGHAASQALATLFRPDPCDPAIGVTLRLDAEIPG